MPDTQLTVVHFVYDQWGGAIPLAIVPAGDDERLERVIAAVASNGAGEPARVEVVTVPMEWRVGPSAGRLGRHG